MNQLFFRKGKFFPPYFFATLFLSCISIMLILLVVEAVIVFIQTEELTFTIIDLAAILGTTAAWMGFYKITDDKKEIRQ